mmetsp:Transcript_27373/g.46564  ORF Transcript_27373/g.46564 Transcript_27373/m.46564 type:complete len:100 (+) Transcript_27373:783-1082(+)
MVLCYCVQKYSHRTCKKIVSPDNQNDSWRHCQRSHFHFFNTVAESQNERGYHGNRGGNSKRKKKSNDNEEMCRLANALEERFYEFKQVLRSQPYTGGQS